MKLTATQKNKLASKVVHIVGECKCSADSKTCTYWKNVDKCDYNWQTELIIREIERL